MGVIHFIKKLPTAIIMLIARLIVQTYLLVIVGFILLVLWVMGFEPVDENNDH